MKNILILIIFFSTLVSAQVSPIEAQYICVNQFQRGFAFNSETKKAWVVEKLNSRSGLEISIYPDDFEIYRCPGCFSFKGFIEKEKAELRQIYAFTHMNTLYHEMWMFYLTQDNSGEMVQETIPCKEY